MAETAEPDESRSPWAMCAKCGQPGRDCPHTAAEVKTCPTWTPEGWCLCPNPKVDHGPFTEEPAQK